MKQGGIFEFTVASGWFFPVQSFYLLVRNNFIDSMKLEKKGREDKEVTKNIYIFF